MACGVGAGEVIKPWIPTAILASCGSCAAGRAVVCECCGHLYAAESRNRRAKHENAMFLRNMASFDHSLSSP